VLTGREQTPLAVGGARVAYEGGRQRRPVARFQPLGPLLELGGSRAARPQGGVDPEDRLGGHRGELRRASEIVRELPTAGCQSDGRLPPQGLRRSANVVGAEAALTQSVERDLVEGDSGRAGHELGPFFPYGIIACRIEGHYRSLEQANLNSYDFTGRVALVTGGASGIGAAAVERLRKGGARVAVFDLSADSDAADLAITGDVSRSDEADAAVARVEEELGGLDILVCAAGIAGESLRTVDVSDEEWNRVFAINANGVFFFNRASLGGMTDRGYGRIVNVASIAGKEGNPMAAAYSASKAAVIAMTKSIGKDVAGTGVLANSIAPAVIHTPMLTGLSDEHLSYMVERIPLGRVGSPEEVADLICFLTSERLSFSTGACFDISGGRATY
jgi:2-dehydro-3-deoxy-L-rhamnonate dehydrogenase (NAD+)